MSEPRFVAIYCENRRREQYAQSPTWKRWLLVNRENIGRCYAERSGADWRCCCCGRVVSVSW